MYLRFKTLRLLLSVAQFSVKWVKGLDVSPGMNEIRGMEMVKTGCSHGDLNCEQSVFMCVGGLLREDGIGWVKGEINTVRSVRWVKACGSLG